MRRWAILSAFAGFILLLLSVRSTSTSEETATIPNPTPSVMVTAHRAPASSKQESELEINSLMDCYSTQNCDFDQSDPRAYDFAVGRAIAERLVQLRNQDNLPRATLEEAAHLALTVPDGFVQEEALRILEDLPPSSKSLERIAFALENNPDPLIVEQSMKEMKRYLGGSEERIVLETLTKLIGFGAQFSAEKASELILPFLNERSLPTFERTLQEMQPHSTAAINLRSALRAYNLSKQGA